MAELNIAIRLDAIPGELRGRANLLRGLSTVARLGASSVELCARTTIRPSELSDTGLRQLRKMLDDLNLRVAAVRFQTRRGYDTLDQLDRRVEATKQAMQLAYRLGSSIVVSQIGRVPDPSQVKASRPAGDESAGAIAAPPPDPDSDLGRWQTLQTVLDDLGRYGAHVGAVLAAETGTEPGSWLAEMLDASDQAFVAAALNPGQLIINRQSVPDAVVALRDRIQLVAAVDGVIDLAAGRGLSVPLGQGTADFPQIIGLLENVQYRGPYVLGRPWGDARDRGRVSAGDASSVDKVLQELRQGVDYLRAMQ